MSFYNTTHESGQMLLEFSKVNDVRNCAVLDVFKNNPDKSFTPFEVMDQLACVMEFTSVRRAITDLTDMGLLINTGVKVLERKGRPNFKWRYND